MKKIFDPEMQFLNETWQAFPWEDRQAYAAYLAQTYYYVRHSCRLLAFAAGLADFSAQPYFSRSIKHISEESNHEILAERDLMRLGFKLADFEELGMTRAMYECQYYKIQNQDPTSLLGYILALEGIAVNAVPLVFPRLQKAYDPKSLTFLRVHSEEDPDHLEKAFQQIEKLTAPQREFVRLNFLQTCQIYAQFLEMSLQQSQRGKGLNSIRKAA